MFSSCSEASCCHLIVLRLDCTKARNSMTKISRRSTLVSAPLCCVGCAFRFQAFIVFAHMRRALPAEHGERGEEHERVRFARLLLSSLVPTLNQQSWNRAAHSSSSRLRRRLISTASTAFSALSSWSVLPVRLLLII